MKIQKMISPKEIKEKAEKWWASQAFLQAWLAGQDFFEGGREIAQIGLVKPNEVSSKFFQIKAEQEQLKAYSKKEKGIGYQLIWEKVNNRQLGENEFIRKIYFETAEDFLKFIKKEADFEAFKVQRQFIITTFPALEQWILKHPLKVIEHAAKWGDLLKICQYFVQNPKPNLYIRQLPIENLHTKFIENNKPIIASLLNFILPPESINTETNDFENRFGLLESQPLIRFVILDNNLFINNLSDITLPVSQFETLFIQTNINQVFVAENQMCVLTFPKTPKSIIVFGGGKAVSNLSHISWLKTKHVYYWGDLDVEGFEILSILRKFKPDAISLMMDFDCFSRFSSEGLVEGKDSVKKLPPDLTEEETRLFEHLKSLPRQSNRLEQEKIPQWYVERCLQIILYER